MNRAKFRGFWIRYTAVIWLAAAVVFLFAPDNTFLLTAIVFPWLALLVSMPMAALALRLGIWTLDRIADREADEVKRSLSRSTGTSTEGGAANIDRDVKRSKDQHAE